MSTPTRPPARASSSLANSALVLHGKRPVLDLPRRRRSPYQGANPIRPVSEHVHQKSADEHKRRLLALQGRYEMPDGPDDRPADVVDDGAPLDRAESVSGHVSDFAPHPVRVIS